MVCLSFIASWLGELVLLRLSSTAAAISAAGTMLSSRDFCYVHMYTKQVVLDFFDVRYILSIIFIIM